MTIANYDVALHWAKGEEGYFASRHLTMDGRRLMSYREPIGYRINDYALISTMNWSSTTANHQGNARAAARQVGLRAISLNFGMLQVAFASRFSLDIEPAELLDLRELEWPKRQSSLFRVQGKYYLFSHDGDSWRFHREFGVLLPYPCGNVLQAFDMLKPLAVRNAELEGIEVKRQGEWFFIPLNGEAPLLEPTHRWYELRAHDRAQPHKVTRADISAAQGIVYAKGTVRHQEHSMLRLGDTWHEVAKNTAVESYSPLARGLD